MFAINIFGETPTQFVVCASRP